MRGEGIEGGSIPSPGSFFHQLNPTIMTVEQTPQFFISSDYIPDVKSPKWEELAKPASFQELVELIQTKEPESKQWFQFNAETDLIYVEMNIPQEDIDAGKVEKIKQGFIDIFFECELVAFDNGCKIGTLCTLWDGIIRPTDKIVKELKHQLESLCGMEVWEIHKGPSEKWESGCWLIPSDPNVKYKRENVNQQDPE